MSTVQPVPTPAPVVVKTTPPPAMDWNKILLVIFGAIAALLAGRETKPTPAPVTPPVVVIDPNVQPTPQTPPNEKPDPLKPTPVTPPTVGFTVADSKGSPILDEVGSCQQIVFKPTAKTGAVLWIVDPPIQQTLGLDNSIILTTPGTYTVLTIREVVTVGGQLSVQTASIRCGHAPQPPPIVDPPVNNPPPVVNPPGPVVVIPPVPAGSKKFNFYVVEDKGVTRTMTTASITSNLAIQTELRSKGHTFIPTTNVEDKDGAAAYAKREGTSLPALVLYDQATKQFVKSVPLPTDLGLSLMTSMGG